MDITDTEAVWNMLMEPITVVDMGNVKGRNFSQLTKQNLYMYREPDKSSKIVGEITNLSQGLRVIEHLDNGWSLVECYSSSFISKPATQIQAWNILVSGYIESKYLNQVQPTDKLALVVDKLAQRLYVFQEGKMIATLLCSTGLVQWNGSKYQPYNETRSGEFLLINMTGQLTSDRLICSYAIRFNGGDEIHEVPTRWTSRRLLNYNTTEPDLGTKKSHGCIRVQRLPTPDGINMAWIYKRVRDLDLCGKVKFVIWEDWQGRQLPTRIPGSAAVLQPEQGAVLPQPGPLQKRKRDHLLPLLLFPAGRRTVSRSSPPAPTVFRPCVSRKSKPSTPSTPPAGTTRSSSIPSGKTTTNISRRSNREPNFLLALPPRV